MFYYELNVSGVIHDYQIGVISPYQCCTMYEVIDYALHTHLFENDVDSDSVLSYSILSENTYKEKYF